MMYTQRMPATLAEREVGDRATKWLVVHADQRTRERLSLACADHGAAVTLESCRDVQARLPLASTFIGLIVGRELADGTFADVIHATRTKQQMSVLVIATSGDPGLVREVFRTEAALLYDPFRLEDLTLFFQRSLRLQARRADRDKTCADVFSERFDLTPRQRDIIQGVIAGQPRCELAASMHISQSTLKWHVNSLLRKCGSSSLSEAACLALRG